jgi:hypothetical protein
MVRSAIVMNARSKQQLVYLLGDISKVVRGEDVLLEKWHQLSAHCR